MEIENIKTSRNTYMIVVVAALGYFVDIYDLVLFGVVRKASLTELGLNPDQIKSIGEQLLNWQMAGMLLGGIFWGILGDKKGRLSVLFGSILTYSLANIANGFVDSVPMYAVLRFLAGVGLAGELGAGITLVSETMHKDKRGYGTMMRMGIFESGMYAHVATSNVSKGNFFSLFTSRKTAYKYFSIIATGLPIWYVMGVLVTFSPETAKAMGMTELPKAGTAVTFAFAGLTLGDFLSGMISQMIKSRKKNNLFVSYINLLVCMRILSFCKRIADCILHDHFLFGLVYGILGCFHEYCF